jgi:putative ABC transport system permease protein
MKRPPRLPPSLHGPRRVEQEVDAELAFHVDMTMQMLAAQGMTAEAARAEAVRRFGDMAVVSAECRRFGRERDRSRSRAEYLTELRQDLGFAIRQLARARGFAATAAGTLALGIGATVAVFSALYAVALQPLPFTDADRVVQIVAQRGGRTEDIFSSGEFAAIRERTDAFSHVAAVTGGGFTLTGMGAPELIGGTLVTADYFRVLGVGPLLGRGFLPTDDVPGAPHVVLMSHRLWTSRFSSDTSLVGRTIRLDDEPHTVIGVLPAAFDATGTDDELWAPRQLTTAQLTSNSGRWLRVVARLAPGASMDRAASAAGTAMQSLAARTPGVSQNVGAIVRRYIDGVAGAPRERLLVLFGAVVLVLLIACVNVANLLLARSTVRARELAIRAALGAGRGRLVRQLLVESLVLSLGAAAAGVIIAFGLVKALVILGPADTPRLDQARVNGVALAFTLGLALASSLVVGLVPALRSAPRSLQSTLREGGRGTAGGQRDRLRAVLVAAEVALAMTLLIGAGLLIRSAWLLQRVDPGFRAERVVTARVLLPAARYRDAAHIARTYIRIREAALQVPGVQQAALVSVVPLTGGILGTRIASEGTQPAPDDRLPVDIRYASPDYFAAMGMPLRDGRDFVREDDATAAPVAVISGSLAQTLWPGERAVGKRVDAMQVEQGKPNWITVVGVVADVHNAALNEPAKPTLYMPFTQTSDGMWRATGRSLVLVARTTPVPESIVRALQQAVMTVDPLLPLVDVNTMQNLVSDSMATTRFNTLLLSTLGALALVLASVGVYGVVAYYVSQRTREIGVHMALGATPGDIWLLVLTRGLRPIVWGVIVGVALSLATARVLRGQLYGVSAQDPATLAAVAVTLLGVALIATFVPALRAIRVTPARALASD